MMLHIMIVKFLAKRNILDKVLNDRSYEFARSPKYDGYQIGLPSMAYNFFDKKTGSIVSVNKEIHKPVIKKFKRRKV